MSEEENKAKVIEQLKKVLALAERGLEGEAVAAQDILQKQLEKHGLRLEDLIESDQEEYKIKYKNLQDQKILAQILVKVCGSGKEIYVVASRKVLVVELSESQINQVLTEYSWHQKNFREELSKLKTDFLKAYIQRHRLFDEDGGTTTVSSDLFEMYQQYARRMEKSLPLTMLEK